MGTTSAGAPRCSTRSIRSAPPAALRWPGSPPSAPGLSATLLLAAALNLVAALGALALSRPVETATSTATPSAVGQRGVPCWCSSSSWERRVSATAGCPWTRALVFHLGSSVYAYSLMLSLFLAGVGLGSLVLGAVGRSRHVAARRTRRGRNSALAVWGIAQVPLFASLARSLAAWSELLHPQSFGGGAAVQLLAVLPLVLRRRCSWVSRSPWPCGPSDRQLDPLGRDVGSVFEAEHDVPTEKSETAFIAVGESHLELLEPTDPSSVIAKFLEKRSGVHHICLLVDDIEKTMAEMKAAGARLLDETPRIGAGGCRVAFIHPKVGGGRPSRTQTGLRGGHGTPSGNRHHRGQRPLRHRRFRGQGEVAIETPFGVPSDAFIVGKFGDRSVAFLPRHGRGHRILPSELNFRRRTSGP